MSWRHNRLCCRELHAHFGIVRWVIKREDIRWARNVFIFISPDRNILRRKFSESKATKAFYNSHTLSCAALLYLPRSLCNIVLMLARLYQGEKIFFYLGRDKKAPLFIMHQLCPSLSHSTLIASCFLSSNAWLRQRNSSYYRGKIHTTFCFGGCLLLLPNNKLTHQLLRKSKYCSL